MIQTPEISIIVPVYKVEHYLPQCLDSIMRQTFTAWECILVDDGSPDNCGEICDQYAARDGRFHVIHQKNGGLSAARNRGMSVAKAQYIGFVDSDDWIEPEMFRTLYDLIRRDDYDMAQVSFFNEYRGATHRKQLVRDMMILDRKAAVRQLFLDRRLPNYIWLKLINRRIIDSPFPEGKIFEDIHVLNHWVRNIRKMIISPETLYHYRRRKGSIINSNYAANRMEYLTVCLNRIKEFHEIEPEAFSAAEGNAYIWKAAINAAKTISRYETDPEKRIGSVREISALTRKFPSPSLRWLSLKAHWRARLLMNHPERFCRLMRFVHRGDLQTIHRQNHLFD